MQNIGGKTAAQLQHAGTVSAALRLVERKQPWQRFFKFHFVVKACERFLRSPARSSKNVDSCAVGAFIDGGKSNCFGEHAQLEPEQIVFASIDELFSKPKQRKLGVAVDHC